MVECAVCSLLYLNPVPTVDGAGTDRDPGSLLPLAAGAADDGEIVVATPNADSWSRRVFGGRHWSSYDFPNRPRIFGPDSLARLARDRGYRVVAVRTRSERQVWTDSLRNLLADWDVSPFWMRAGSGLAARTVAGVV
jgi:hypothetical protein